MASISAGADSSTTGIRLASDKLLDNAVRFCVFLSFKTGWWGVRGGGSVLPAKGLGETICFLFVTFLVDRSVYF
jgi:hypothetical protein